MFFVLVSVVPINYHRKKNIKPQKELTVMFIMKKVISPRYI